MVRFLRKYVRGLKDTEPLVFEKIDGEKVKATIEKIDGALADREINKKVNQKLNYAKKNWFDNLERHKQQEEILGKRNRYSKTDNDATFMRMKEDRMKKVEIETQLLAIAHNLKKMAA